MQDTPGKRRVKVKRVGVTTSDGGDGVLAVAAASAGEDSPKKRLVKKKIRRTVLRSDSTHVGSYVGSSGTSVGSNFNKPSHAIFGADGKKRVKKRVLKVKRSTSTSLDARCSE